MNTATDYKLLTALISVILLNGCQLQIKDFDGDQKANHIAEEFLAAYNAHDQNLMLSLVHPEIKYMYINSDQIYTETNSKQNLAEFLSGFFEQNPAAQSRLLSTQQQGPFVHQVEQAIWINKDGNEKSQCSLSVYEIKQQLIINIWYFTVFKCPSN